MQAARTLSIQRGNQCACCCPAELLLADKFNLAVALVDVHANLAASSARATSLLNSHAAFIHSVRRIGLVSQNRSQGFRIALRCVLSGQPTQTLRADDGCMQAPLILQISNWPCSQHCLVSFHPLTPESADLKPIQGPYGLTNRQVQLLQLFTSGLPLAGIAGELNMRPQSIRESFSSLYARFELRNQLELLSALKSLQMISSE